jgi:hypothetical protein
MYSTDSFVKPLHNSLDTGNYNFQRLLKIQAKVLFFYEYSILSIDVNGEYLW